MAIVTTPLNYSTDGDTNGLVYLCGSNDLQRAYANPVSADGTTFPIAVTASTTLIGSAANICSRTNTDYWHSDNKANSWIKMEISDALSFVIKGINLQTRNADSQHRPKHFQIQASTNGTDWDALATNSKEWGQGQWKYFDLSFNETAYKYFRVYATGLNHQNYHYFVLQEVELYGELTYDGVGYSEVTGVLRLDGSPVAGAPVSICSADGTSVLKALTTDANGVYQYTTRGQTPVLVLAVPPEGYRPLAHGPVTPSLISE